MRVGGFGWFAWRGCCRGGWRNDRGAICMLVFDRPALPGLGCFHALLASCLQTLGPLFGGGRAKGEGMVQVLGHVLDVLVVVVLCNLDIGRRRRCLQGMGGDVIAVGGDESKGKGGSKGRGGGEEQAGVLCEGLVWIEVEMVSGTHCLALLHQTRTTSSNGKRPYCADSSFTRALLPHVVTRSGGIDFSTKLTRLGPNELPHV